MTGKTALVLRHVAHEGPAGFATPLAAAGYAVDLLDIPRRGPGDAARSADLLVVMGGPMGAYETGAHPWLADEVRAIGERIAAGRPTLGICLGGQLIAAALGARVYPGPVKEVGFAAVTLLPEGMASPLRHLAGVPLLHWHGDTFDLPEGVERLASTAAYPNQAFRRGNRLLALQCHPEMGDADDRFSEWLDGSDAYLAQAGLTAGRLASEHRHSGPAAARAGRAMLAEWLDQLPE